MRSLVATCALVFIASTSSAATYVVHPDGTGDYPTIQAAIDACLDGDVIELSAGIFAGEGNNNLDYSGKAITIRGDGTAGSFTIDCGGTNRGLHFHSGEGASSVLQDVTIINGFALKKGLGQAGVNGGAVLCTSASSPTIEDCIFQDCVAPVSGGGVHCQDLSSPTFTACEFNHCTAQEDDGGGAHLVGAGSVVFTNCVFRGNGAWDRGGGLYAEASTPTLRGCRFESNEAGEDPGNLFTGHGGGMASRDGHVTLLDCEFSSNAAGYSAGGLLIGGPAVVVRTAFSQNWAGNGGAIFCYRPALILSCTFDANRATRNDPWVTGGAMYFFSSGLTQIVGCTLHGNELPDVPGPGSGSGLVVSGSDPTWLEVENTIIAFGQGDDGGPPVGCTSGGEIRLTCTDVYPEAVFPPGGCLELVGSGNIFVDPLFVDGPGGDFALQTGSPCLPAQSECGLVGAWGEAGQAAPAAIFGATPRSGEAPLTVQFFDGSSGEPTSWAWDFGDGGTSDLRHPSHVYASPGDYTISLSVSNGVGDVVVKQGYVTVTGSANGTMHVADIVVSRKDAGANHSGVAVITIRDDGGQPVTAATVTATVTEGPPVGGTFIGSTGADGTVQFQTERVRIPVERWCFEVSEVVHDVLTWDGVVMAACEGDGAGGDGVAGLSSSFQLVQNYPDPFNPVTEIAFDLPQAAPVRLTVFDAQGRCVATLVEGNLPRGRHRVRWDAGEATSGVYFCRMQAAGFTDTRKMILLK